MLSDTRDPDIWVRGGTALAPDVVRALDGQGRIFYRNRVENTSRKSGNIADFCRRWGGRYRYMIVLDADSIMSGDDPGGDGAAHGAPSPRGPDPGRRRCRSTASRCSRACCSSPAASTGGMFTAGLHYWQLGDSNYWGHNAIIRVKPFVDHCGLPKLPGREPFGGEILSHDFVEAALLRRAGWEVWLAYDLGGSYEEIPPTLIDYAKRDRRWCQGNLQHLRLILARGFKALSRIHLLMGVMSYLASPLWLLFLIAHRRRGLFPESDRTGLFLRRQHLSRSGPSPTRWK